MNIMHRLFPGLLFTFTAFVAPVVAKDAPASTATRHSSVWKVQGDKATVYLAGSVHVLKAENYPLPKFFDDAYTNSSIIYFEIDPGLMRDPSVAMQFTTRARLPEGETLSQRLSAGTYSSLVARFKAIELPEAMFAQMKPGMVAMTLVMLELQKLGCHPELGLDMHFEKRAKTDRKPVKSLETVEFQMDLLTNLSKEEDEGITKSTLADIGNMGKELDEMLKAWQAGDDAVLQKMLNESIAEFPSLYKRMLSDRNQTWVGKLDAILKGDQNVMVVVGVGHLVGNDGVVERLRKKGFKVTQL